MKRFINFAKVGDLVYDCKLHTSLMTSPGETTKTNYLTTLRLEITPPSKNQQFSVKLTRKINLSLDKADRWNLYHKAGHWYQINPHQVSRFLGSLRSSTSPVGARDRRSFLYPDNIQGIDMNSVNFMRIFGDCVYFFVGSRNQTRIKMVQYRAKEGKRGVTESSFLRKEFGIERSTRFFLDHGIEDFRIFLFEKAQEGDSHLLKVLDENLDVIGWVRFEGVSKIEKCLAINSGNIYLTVVEVRQEDERRRSLLVNWRERTAVELVGEDGEPFFGEPMDCFGGEGYLAFSRFFYSLDNQISDGIYLTATGDEFNLNR